jgi:hypothetical protein
MQQTLVCWVNIRCQNSILIPQFYSFTCWSAMGGRGEGGRTIVEQVRDQWTESICRRTLTEYGYNAKTSIYVQY